jgi:acyl carrier protein
VEEKLKSVMSSVLELPADQINESTTMESVDTWDSLRHMEIIVAIEETFSIELAADEVVDMTSFVEIRRVLAGKGVQV